jgi:HD-like signal output (HDOD) protein
VEPLTVLSHIAESAKRDDFIFPTTAEIAFKVQRILDDPDSSVDQILYLVRSDPFLAARVVALANTVIYNRSNRIIDDIKSAISCIGLHALRVIVAAVVVRQMGKMTSNPDHQKIAATLWEHTSYVAALSQVIARRVTHVNPDTAFFAGVMHEAGSFYLISKAMDYIGLLDGEAGSLMAWDESGAAEIGRVVLHRLRAPPGVIEAIEGLWGGYLTMPPHTLSDTLLLADRLAPVESPLSQLAGTGCGDTKSKIDISLDEQTLSEILEESTEEVKSLLEALRT